MNQLKSKKFRQEFKDNFQDKIQEAAEKICTDKIQKEIRDLKTAGWKIARKRDIIFLIAMGEMIIIILLLIIHPDLIKIIGGFLK